MKVFYRPPRLPRCVRSGTGMNVQACGYGIGQCDEGLLSPAEAAQVSVRSGTSMNVQACGYGIGQCNRRLLSPAEAAQVSAIRRRMNVQACEYGIGDYAMKGSAHHL
jgi:hypothetical protein